MTVTVDVAGKGESVVEEKKPGILYSEACNFPNRAYIMNTHC